MNRLTWRQHRLQALSTAALLAALACFLVLTEHQMTSYMAALHLPGCLASHGDCGQAVSLFNSRFNGLGAVVNWLNMVPMLAGVFIGAPLIAREVEQGTHRLAFTQSVSRRRWVTTKIAWLTVLVVAAAVVLIGLFTWWFQPFVQVNAGTFGGDHTRITPSAFDFQGVVLIGYTLYAFALGAAAGALIRRTIPAMAVAIAGYLALRFGIQGLRGHLITPLIISHPLGRFPPTEAGSWIVGSQMTDRSGHAVSYNTLWTMCRAQGGDGFSVPCAQAHGILTTDLYQPASRFWALQGIESGIFVTASAVLLALTAWWTIRRLA